MKMDTEINDIFISYAREDRARVQFLAQALEQNGLSVWLDYKIPPGKTFDEVISEALSSAKCVIVLWSEASVKSDWVKEEATEAVQKKILVPVLIDEVEIPLGFRRIQTARLKDRYWEPGNAEFERVLRSVMALVQAPYEHITTKKVTLFEPPSSPLPQAWRAELISKEKNERVIGVYLTHDYRVLKLKLNRNFSFDSCAVNVDGVIAAQVRVWWRKFELDFLITDGSKHYPAIVEGLIGISFTDFISFSLSVSGRRLYVENN